MNTDPLTLTTLAAALGTGLVAGVFFAFSSFVMRGLAGLPAAQGIAAMQSINVAAISRAFMTALFGTAALSLGVGIASLLAGDATRALLGLVGSALYLVGCIGVTIACNVPRNNALAQVSPSDGAALWARYVPEWTRWNHVRTGASLAATTLFVIAFCGGAS
jgi:uncharacterized membrane protein